MDDPRFAIQNWMRNRNTIEFLAVWETLHNPDFNRVQFEAVKNEAGLNRFVEYDISQVVKELHESGLFDMTPYW